MERPSVRPLPGERLHLSHGPIDVVLRAFGRPEAVRRAHAAGAARFETILGELVAELGELRRPASEAPYVRGGVARRMAAAVAPFTDVFVTPMAAVAGSVADELLAAMLDAADLAKAYVNDGGDIAVHLASGETLAIGVAGDFSRGPVPALNGDLVLRAQDRVGGVATSGVNGRSFSRGIADSATVLAQRAAAADAAATLVANAVNIESSAVTRRPACELDPDSDLGARLVTTHIGPLTRQEIAAALCAGEAVAADFLRRGLIRGAVLMLRGESAAVGAPAEALAWA